MEERNLEDLATDIDFRIMELWMSAQEIDEWDIETVAAYMRAAYGRGYIDALNEHKLGEYAKLCRDHGFRIP